MKILPSTFLLLALAALPAVAQVPVAASQFQPLRVAHHDLPVFPQELLQLGVREGHVRVAFSVDPAGRIEDVLAVEHTHAEFARVAVHAIRRWRFEPARYAGQPIASASEVTLKFRVEGTVVVSLTPSEALSVRMLSVGEMIDYYRPRGLKELDRTPTPTAIRSPGIPEQFAKAGKSGHVTVTFYIDETGAVRLPSVGSDSDAVLAAAAIDAMRTWKFEPPTYKGRPVLVRASQRFNFGPALAANAK